MSTECMPTIGAAVRTGDQTERIHLAAELAFEITEALHPFAGSHGSLERFEFVNPPLPCPTISCLYGSSIGRCIAERDGC